MTEPSAGLPTEPRHTDGDVPTSFLRVLVLGTSGSGKTTVGRFLSRRFGLPQFDLDDLMPLHRGRADRAGFLQNLSEAVAQPRWVITGRDRETLAMRATAADYIVILDPSPVVCLVRGLVLRPLRRRLFGEDLLNPEGRRNRDRWHALRYAMSYPRLALGVLLSRHRELPETLGLLREAGIEAVVHLKGDRKIQAFLRRLETSTAPHLLLKGLSEPLR